MSEKLCLQWNHFQDNVRSAFGNLREGTDFADVTLACEDGQQIEAHKVILAASSPFFQAILKRNTHSHPLIYMRGMNSVDMVAIVDFLYFGEVNVYKENFDAFLAIAEELQLKGLKGSNDQNESSETELQTRPKQNYRTNQNTSDSGTTSDEQSDDLKRIENNALAISMPVSADLQHLDETVKSMMEKSHNKFKIGNRQKLGKTCKVCGKEGLATDIMRHIEAHHVEGVEILCNHCEKIFSSRKNLRDHISKYHRQQ